MISEVPLGAFLSGGVDSSAVVAMMAEVSDEPVNTCSIAFSDPTYDESAWAQQVADRYATRHFVDRVESDDFDLIDDLARIYDEPYADSSAIPTYRVCGLARRHVTVALSGDGGDESFGGYRRYRLHVAEERLRSAMSQSVRRPLFGLLGRAYPEGRLGAARVPRQVDLRGARARFGGRLFPRRLDPARRHAPRAVQQRVQGAAGGYNAVAVFHRHAQRANGDDPLALVQYLDLKTYLVGDINTKVDRASMAHSLEVREPLMDHQLVEWLASLPRILKMKGNEGKHLLKKGHGAAPSRGTAVPRRSRDSPFRSPAGSAARCGSAFTTRSSARGLPPRASSTRTTCSTSWRLTRRARATTAHRCGRC